MDYYGRMSEEGQVPAPDGVLLWDESDLDVDELSLPEDPVLRGAMPVASPAAPPVQRPATLAGPGDGQGWVDGGWASSGPAAPSAVPPSASWETYSPNATPGPSPSSQGAQSGSLAPTSPGSPARPPTRKNRGAVVAVGVGAVAMVAFFTINSQPRWDYPPVDPYTDVGYYPEDDPELYPDIWRDADRDAAAGIVGVTATSTSGAERSGGGLLVKVDTDSTGYIVTAYHLVVGSSGVEVGVAGSGSSVARVVGFDVTKDIAVLRVPDFYLTEPAQLGQDVPTRDESVTILHDFQDGESVKAAESSVTSTRASATIKTDPNGDGFLSRPSGLLNVVAPDVAADAGDAIVNLEGEVAGMAVWQGSGTSDLYVVPSKDIDSVVEAVIEGEDTGTVRVGSGGGLGLFLQTTGQLPTVTNVLADGPAAKAGIKAGDYIVKIGDASLALKDLDTVGTEGIIRMLEPGSQVPVTWRPAGGGEDQTATLTVAENATN